MEASFCNKKHLISQFWHLCVYISQIWRFRVAKYKTARYKRAVMRSTVWIMRYKLTIVIEKFLNTFKNIFFVFLNGFHKSSVDLLNKRHRECLRALFDFVISQQVMSRMCCWSWTFINSLWVLNYPDWSSSVCSTSRHRSICRMSWVCVKTQTNFSWTSSR